LVAVPSLYDDHPTSLPAFPSVPPACATPKSNIDASKLKLSSPQALWPLVTFVGPSKRHAAVNSISIKSRPFSISFKISQGASSYSQDVSKKFKSK
jgi:hypothetical protein